MSIQNHTSRPICSNLVDSHTYTACSNLLNVISSWETDAKAFNTAMQPASHVSLVLIHIKWRPHSHPYVDS